MSDATVEKRVDYQQCAYRGAAGTSCAVGCLISDDEYKPEMETLTARSLCRNGQTSARLRHHEDLLGALQVAHDDYLTLGMVEWELRMRRITEDFGLDFTEVPTALEMK